MFFAMWRGLFLGTAWAWMYKFYPQPTHRMEQEAFGCGAPSALSHSTARLHQVGYERTSLKSDMWREIQNITLGRLIPLLRAFFVRSSTNSSSDEKAMMVRERMETL